MTDIHKAGLPGTPSSPGAWDARSEQCLAAVPPAGPAPRRAPRRGPADPVKTLMHHHRGLCERAVDPLEIAAGLEAQGITDRTAARFRHKDVFSLAEEMYARVPRGNDTLPVTTPAPLTEPRPGTGRLLRALLPGAAAAATVAALHLTHGRARLLAVGAGTAAVALALRAALTRGPQSTGNLVRTLTTPLWVCWLLAYAALGDGLLKAAASGGPETLPTIAPGGPWPVSMVPLLALTASCAPAAWLAHHFTARARRTLSTSRTLREFAAAVRPLLLGTFALCLAAVAALLTLAAALLREPAPYPQALTLAALFVLARLLAVHGFTHASAVMLTATATAQATALATLFAGRLPHCGFLATPVRALTDTWGPAAVPTLTCGAAALTLLIHATRTLPRASAHARTAGGW
ncbi:hypothetical protein [Streptomyces cinereospinus]|uniref:Integral membrane protein n=1 Tax=Streptomyces cinereospinus TaxID=285561 RepID=A0ABV5N0M2_9ACTN